MKLLTKALEKALPPLYSQEDVPDPLVRAHFFNPSCAGDWWIVEGSHDGDDYRMFGLCDLGWPELGYVSLNELQDYPGRFGLGIERDRYWVPKPPSEIKEES